MFINNILIYITTLCKNYKDDNREIFIIQTTAICCINHYKEIFEFDRYFSNHLKTKQKFNIIQYKILLKNFNKIKLNTMMTLLNKTSYVNTNNTDNRRMKVRIKDKHVENKEVY